METSTNVKYKNHQVFKGPKGGRFITVKGKKIYIPKLVYKDPSPKKKKEIQKTVLESKKKDNKNLIDILNHAYHHMKKSDDTSPDIFLKGRDDVLISMLKELSLIGWKTLNSLELSKEVHCNELCACVALINFNLIKKKNFSQLNILEKLYLALFHMFTMFPKQGACNPPPCKDLFFGNTFNWCKNKGINNNFKKEIKEKIENIDNHKITKQEFFLSLFTYYKDIIAKNTGEIVETKKMSHQIPKANHNLYLLIKSFLDDDTKVEEEIDKFFKESKKFKEDIFKNDLICIAYFLNDTFKSTQVVNDKEGMDNKVNFSIFIQKYYNEQIVNFCNNDVLILKGLIYLLYDFNYIYNSTDITRYLNSKRILNYTNMILNLNINIFDYIDKLKDDDVIIKNLLDDMYYLKTENAFYPITDIDFLKKNNYFVIQVSTHGFRDLFYEYRKYKKTYKNESIDKKIHHNYKGYYNKKLNNKFISNDSYFFLKNLNKSEEEENLHEIFEPNEHNIGVMHFIVCPKKLLIN